MKKEKDVKRILCLVGITTGIMFTVCGFKDGLYSPDLNYYTFGSDYNTETYNAAVKTFEGIISAVHVLGDLLAAFGLFEICFFGIKLVEINEREKKVISASEPKSTKQNNDSNKSNKKEKNMSSEKSKEKSKNSDA